MTSEAAATPKESLVEQLVAINVSMITLATITVAARIITRLTLTSSRLGLDDWTVLVCLAFAIATAAIHLYGTRLGLGQHIADLPPGTDLLTLQELFIVAQPLYMIAVALTKVAVLFLYLRLVPQRSYRVVIWLFMAFVVATALACVVADIFQCTPIAWAWNKHLEGGGTCINQTALYYSNAALDIFQDLFIYCLPLKGVYDLQIPKRQKIALGAIFAVGGFVCITGIVRLNSIKTAAVTEDSTWYHVDVANWSAIEVNVGIFCASLPHFKPLVHHFFPSLMSSSPQSRSRRSTYRRTGPRQDVKLEKVLTSATTYQNNSFDHNTVVKGSSGRDRFGSLEHLTQARPGNDVGGIYKSTSFELVGLE